PLGNSMSHKVPVTAILDSGANCNIIVLFSKLNILEIIRAIAISILSQYHKQEQVEVTDVFVTDELESILILGQSWFQENVMEMDFPNKTLTLLNGTSYE
ncbi:8097_t:CDS:2, partial [Paraglomus occultum]